MRCLRRHKPRYTLAHDDGDRTTTPPDHRNSEVDWLLHDFHATFNGVLRNPHVPQDAFGVALRPQPKGSLRQKRGGGRRTACFIFHSKPVQIGILAHRRMTSAQPANRCQTVGGGSLRYDAPGVRFHRWHTGGGMSLHPSIPRRGACADVYRAMAVHGPDWPPRLLERNLGPFGAIDCGHAAAGAGAAAPPTCWETPVAHRQQAGRSRRGPCPCGRRRAAPTDPAQHWI